jgi:hypothetical protein
MRKKKDPAAVALGRKGGKARLKTLTQERRSAIARHANLVRYGKAKPPDAKPTRWWGLFSVPSDDGVHPSGEAELLDYSQDPAELLQRATEVQSPIIKPLDYDPTKFTIVREFKPDEGAQLKALRVALDADEEGDQS